MKKIIFLFTANLFFLNLWSQNLITNKKGSYYKFKILSNIESTEVQNQGKTSTCWSFSALSFIESEIMRLGAGKHELSEMFIVRNSYSDKADKYVRMHGNLNFGPGGAFHDVIEMIDNYGILPSEIYPGKTSEEEN